MITCVLCSCTEACDIWSVIHFLNSRNLKQADIYQQVCKPYREHAMSEPVVQRRVRNFNNIRQNVHDDSQVGWPFVVYEDLICVMEKKVHDDM